MRVHAKSGESLKIKLGQNGTATSKKILLRCITYCPLSGKKIVVQSSETYVLPLKQQCTELQVNNINKTSMQKENPGGYWKPAFF